MVVAIRSLSTTRLTRSFTGLSYARILGRKFMSAFAVGDRNLGNGDFGFAPTNADTDSTAARSVRWVDVEIIARQWVPSFACSLAVVSGRLSGAAQAIFSVCDRLFMRWINADRSATKMIASECGRDGLDEHLISNAMRKTFLARIAKHSIAFVIFVGRPIPARIAVVEMLGRYFDFGKETSENFAVKWQSVRIRLGHFISLILGKVSLPGLTFTASVRAFFMLPQTEAF
jgi:hypothetical protein